MQHISPLCTQPCANTHSSHVQVGSVVTAQCLYHGGEQGQSRRRWYRVRKGVNRWAARRGSADITATGSWQPCLPHAGWRNGGGWFAVLAVIPRRVAGFLASAWQRVFPITLCR